MIEELSSPSSPRRGELLRLKRASSINLPQHRIVTRMSAAPLPPLLLLLLIVAIGAPAEASLRRERESYKGRGGARLKRDLLTYSDESPKAAAICPMRLMANLEKELEEEGEGEGEKEEEEEEKGEEKEDQEESY